MATDRTAFVIVPAAAALLLWPAVWNGYPIVFADTGTYLGQAIHRFAGWDRPVFYSWFMLPLHAMVTLWPVIVVQAVLTALILRLVQRFHEATPMGGGCEVSGATQNTVDAIGAVSRNRCTSCGPRSASRFGLPSYPILGETPCLLDLIGEALGASH